MRLASARRSCSLPAKPAICTLRALDKLRLSPLYKWVYETVTEDCFVSIEKAETVLGYAPKYSNQRRPASETTAGTSRTCTTSRASPGVSHRVPWKQGVLGLAKMVF